MLTNKIWPYQKCVNGDLIKRSLIFFSLIADMLRSKAFWTPNFLLNRHGKTGGSGRVKWVTGHFKWVKNRFGSTGLQVRSGWVGLTRIFHMNLFFIFYFYKGNNMYLPFGKLCNKLLDIKCITLSSPLISRMNSVKLINTFSIILKLYKS